GNLILGGTGTTSLDGDLYVSGDFTSGNVVLDDSNFDLYFSGNDIQLNSYTASVGSTVTLDGTSQTLRETYTNNFNLQNIVFAGTGTKTLTQDTYDVNGNWTINAGVTVDFNRNMTFSGSTFTNNGIFNHYGNTITFDRGGAQSIVTNSTTTFYELNFSGGSTKAFTTSGATINYNITIDFGTTLDLGAFDYTLGYS